MARLWLLVVLTWGLLVSGRDQEVETALFEEEAKTGTLDDDDINNSDYDDDEGNFPDLEGVKTLDPEPVKGDSATLGLQEVSIGSALRGWSSTIDPIGTGLRVTCDDEGFKIFLPAAQFSDVKVLGSEDQRSVDHAQCGLNVSRFEDTLTVPFIGCHMEITNSYSLQLSYKDELGEARVAAVSCRPGPESASGLQLRAGVPPGAPASRCRTPPPVRTPPRAEQCTVDLHFVFIIRSTYESWHLDPTRLVIPGTKCRPVVANADFAIFKFKVTECGTRTYDIGMTRFYLAEVQTLVRALNLKYGIITRMDPLRFLLECRYSLADRDQQPFASVGYMVKIPSRDLPSSIPSDGLYGVQLRIATDETFSTFLPSFPTLRYILTKPVYLELSLLSPKPNASILVKYCLAYPQSAKNALVLVYEGCANPNDPNVAILQVSNLHQNRHQRHFEVKAFQFMDVKTKRYLDEQIHFMCSSEVCWSDEKTCEERCFDGKVP
ncbi:zona pellucida sperm-binding protein 1-like isoform X2 [Syngnathoides biaculeatus]|uniref:zona pellucida sperm-binding protein 1-like isoform X2 n=1 Tax=Syngnathoides biaculeatus TaxID=300417 RepID=UPI002ADE042C|nr:zona pellucida sperm-binding protein 1-like isoform X2 [Syngnathoides biaculeatus]